jgi:DNA-binding CsgD family transcriptional regulator
MELTNPGDLVALVPDLRPTGEPLTPVEAGVASRTAAGMSVRAIARATGLSRPQVIRHQAAVLRKLGYPEGE